MEYTDEERELYIADGLDVRTILSIPTTNDTGSITSNDLSILNKNQFNKFYKLVKTEASKRIWTTIESKVPFIKKIGTYTKDISLTIAALLVIVYMAIELIEKVKGLF